MKSRLKELLLLLVTCAVLYPLIHIFRAENESSTLTLKGYSLNEKFIREGRFVDPPSSVEPIQSGEKLTWKGKLSGDSTIVELDEDGKIVYIEFIAPLGTKSDEALTSKGLSFGQTFEELDKQINLGEPDRVSISGDNIYFFWPDTGDTRPDKECLVLGFYGGVQLRSIALCSRYRAESVGYQDTKGGKGHHH